MQIQRRRAQAQGPGIARSFFLTLLFFFQLFAFDGDRAYRFLVEQCALGTREPGSEGHTAAKSYFDSFLKRQKGKYSRDNFTFEDLQRKKVLPLTNFRILFQGKTKQKHLLCAHWDTRPWADRDPDPLKRSMPIPGANDGASGVAVLMALCETFSKTPPTITVEIVFFDGEDYGVGSNDDWFLGSKHFASKAHPKEYAWAILLDMVGDRNLEISIEQNSQASAPALVERIWGLAEQKHIPAFVRAPGPSVLDDHIPLIRRGISAVDLIDFDYPWWHTLEDTPDKCSAASLKAVGEVMEALIYESRP